MSGGIVSMGCDKSREYIIIGAGGHASVIADILLSSGCVVKGFLDDNVAVGTFVLGGSVLGTVDSCSSYPECLFVIGVGDNCTRQSIARAYPLDYGVAIHPSAVLGRDVKIGCGSAIMAGCVINPRTTLGEHCIVNTSASVDHDCRIGDYVHISPGAALGGVVTVGSRTHVAIGACIRNVINVCDDVVVGAGAVVVKDITEPGTYAGVPARRIR